jgi:hypothetical protein
MTCPEEQYVLLSSGRLRPGKVSNCRAGSWRFDLVKSQHASKYIPASHRKAAPPDFGLFNRRRDSPNEARVSNSKEIKLKVTTFLILFFPSAYPQRLCIRWISLQWEKRFIQALIDLYRLSSLSLQHGFYTR